MGQPEKTLALSDLRAILEACEALDEADHDFANHDVADRAEDGAGIARDLIALAEQKLGYERPAGEK